MNLLYMNFPKFTPTYLNTHKIAVATECPAVLSLMVLRLVSWLGLKLENCGYIGHSEHFHGIFFAKRLSFIRRLIFDCSPWSQMDKKHLGDRKQLLQSPTHPLGMGRMEQSIPTSLQTWYSGCLVVKNGYNFVFIVWKTVLFHNFLTLLKFFIVVIFMPGIFTCHFYLHGNNYSSQFVFYHCNAFRVKIELGNILTTRIFPN